jgi:hypothetical protein
MWPNRVGGIARGGALGMRLKRNERLL